MQQVAGAAKSDDPPSALPVQHHHLAIPNKHPIPDHGAARRAPQETPSLDREMALQSAQPLQSRSKGPVDLEALREPSPRGSAQPLIQAADEPHRKQTKEKAHELLRALSLSCSSSFATLRASGKREGLVTAQSMTPMIEQMIDLPRDRVCMDGLSVPVPSPICVQPDRVSGPRSRNA